jgi:glutamate N-acetyltransferase / amino-acid N-acetyltransferase
MSTTWPQGFRAYAANIGVKDNTLDFSVVVGDPGTRCSALFTQSRFAGCSVLISREHAAKGRARGVVTLSKNSNVATGAQGDANARTLLSQIGAKLTMAPEELLIGSTGVIGRQYAMDRITSGVDRLEPSHMDASLAQVAKAMMTTDTVHKTSRRSAGGATIAGVAKGVGMIEPDMATLLTWIFTDADIAQTDLDTIFRRVIARTFNSLSIDSDTSTSDSAAIFASGAAGPIDLGVFEDALSVVCLDLTKQIARDGEGATKLLEVRVDGARDDAQAKRIAKSIVNSPLVKTAVHGADPNWGRIAMAVGKVYDQNIGPDTTVIRFGSMEVYPTPLDDADLDQLSSIMKRDHVPVHVTVGDGAGDWTVYGCDLSREYIAINADYTT